MPRLNLKGMSVEELVALRDRVQAELSRKIGQERGALQKQIDALASIEAGGAVAVGGNQKRARRSSGVAKSAPSKKGNKVEPKYRGPDGETWTGRGRAPRWLAELEAAGKKRETFLI